VTNLHLRTAGIVLIEYHKLSYQVINISFRQQDSNLKIALRVKDPGKNAASFFPWTM